MKWEKTAQFDFGFNLGLFQDRLNFDISYYHKKTTDLLLDCPVPNSTGYTSVFKNIGSVKNPGLDIMISATPFRTKDFTWTSTLNLNYNKNEITKLGETNADIGLMNWVGGYEGVLRVGESMGPCMRYQHQSTPTGHQCGTKMSPSIRHRSAAWGTPHQFLSNGFPPQASFRKMKILQDKHRLWLLYIISFSLLLFFLVCTLLQGHTSVT